MHMRTHTNSFWWPLLLIIILTTAVEGASQSLVRAAGTSQDRGVDMFLVLQNKSHQCHDIISLGAPEMMADIQLKLDRGVSEISVAMLLTQNTLCWRRSNDQIDLYSDGHLVRRIRNGVVDIIDGRPIRGPALEVLISVLEDGELRNNFLNEFAGQSTSSGCADTCRTTYPRPADCDGWWDEYVCCVQEAGYDHCRRACLCFEEHDTKAGQVACLTLANSLYILEGEICVLKLNPFW